MGCSPNSCVLIRPLFITEINYIFSGDIHSPVFLSVDTKLHSNICWVVTCPWFKICNAYAFVDDWKRITQFFLISCPRRPPILPHIIKFDFRHVSWFLTVVYAYTFVNNYYIVSFVLPFVRILFKMCKSWISTHVTP